LGTRSTEPSWRTEHRPSVSPECSDDVSRRAAPDRRICGAYELGVQSARSDVCQALRTCALSAVLARSC